MSDIGPMPLGVKRANVNHEFVALLERTLDDAKMGNIVGGALILCSGHNALDARTALTCPPSLAPMIVAGAEFLKEEVISMVRQAQRGGGRQLLRAGNMPRAQ